MKHTLKDMLNIVYDYFQYDIKAGFDGGYWSKLEKLFFCMYLSSLLGDKFIDFMVDNVCLEDRFNELADEFIKSIGPELFAGPTVIDAPKDEFDEILDKIVNNFEEYRNVEVYNLTRLASFSRFMELYDKDEFDDLLSQYSCNAEDYVKFLNELLEELKIITSCGETTLILKEDNENVQ